MRTRIIVVLVCLLAAAAAVARADRMEDTPLRQSFAMFPMQIGDWRGVQEPSFSDDVLKILGVDDYLTRAYFLPDRAGVGVYVGYWKSQRQGDTMHSPQNCLPGSGWEPVSQSMVNIADPRSTDGRTVPVNRYVIRKGLDRQLVYYWYQSHGRIVGSEYWSKFYLVADAVRLNRSDAAIVRVIAPVRDESPGAEAAADGLARRFVNELIPQLSGFLPS